MPKVYDMLLGLCFCCRRTLGSAQQISGSFLLSTRCFLSYQVAEAPSSRYTSDEVFRSLVTERLEAKAMAVTCPLPFFNYFRNVSDIGNVLK